MSTSSSHSLGHAPAPFLQQTQRIETSRNIYISQAVDFLQLRVKAKLDKIKEALQWEQYLRNCDTAKEEAKTETDPTPVPTPHISVNRPNVNDNVENEEVSKKKTRRPTKLNEEKNRTVRRNQNQGAAVGSSLCQLDEQNIPLTGNSQSLSPKLGLRFQEATKPRVSFNNNLFGSHFQQENVQTVRGKLLPNSCPRFKSPEKKTTHIVRNPLDPVRRSFLHIQERRLRNEANKSRVISKNFPLHAGKRVQPDRPKSAPTKSVQFANDLKHVDKRQKHQSTSTTDKNDTLLSESVRQLLRKWEENSEKHMQAQISELKDVRAELDKLQEQEDQIRRKWNQFSRSRTLKKDDQGARPKVLLYQPLVHSSSDHLHNRPEFAQAKPKIHVLEGIADSLFDDALHEVSEELSRISEDCVSRIYEEEFISPSFAE